MCGSRAHINGKIHRIMKGHHHHCHGRAEINGKIHQFHGSGDHQDLTFSLDISYNCKVESENKTLLAQVNSNLCD